ncbi:hypothetical protein AUJ84_03270 [Candidatus Pacearchaeota archaeon CG1_02_32_132]|nr:MAG: hypothetical protein AUJ84_03270 [Candidatus Pacearchaeota archaeon CG1_02_32_132]
MNKRGGIFISLLIVAAALAVGFYFGMKANNQDIKVSELESQLLQKDGTINELQNKVQELNNEKIQDYSCPDSDLINCMPLVQENLTKYCSGEYHDWIVESCNTTFIF